MGTGHMVAGERIEWRRSFPRHQVRVLGGCAAGGALVVAAAWMFFGAEPARLNTGAANPLAVVPQWTLGAAAAVVLAAAAPVLRRPMVAASEGTLFVRPGAYRTLELPWATVAGLAGVATRGGEFLLIRLRPPPGGDGAARPGGDGAARPGGDGAAPPAGAGEPARTRAGRPGFFDRTVLRSAARSYPAAAGYDLAVRLRDFAGAPAAKMTALAAYAPEAVDITCRL
ncbi:hypothetical protein Vau01_015450 [Virgisporangium aurantiacum]|uniref:PH domain-containing protein n=2 Tax=Virgisporangium aurantiacum TaxID=175570 RepID=A0A8J3YYI5_9ACTN|nr:hypothetical protein Vau01_015450 [Virgisporangium aurantiacum]